MKDGSVLPEEEEVMFEYVHIAFDFPISESNENFICKVVFFPETKWKLEITHKL